MKKLLTILATIAIMTIAGSAMTDMDKVHAAEAAPEQNMAADICTAINAERAKVGLAAVTLNADLTNAAAVRSVEISNTFSHTRPDGSDWYTVNANIMMGENLAYGYVDAADVMNGWMSSPSHKANILTPEFQTVGISVYNANGTLYFAQEFGY